MRTKKINLLACGMLAFLLAACHSSTQNPAQDDTTDWLFVISAESGSVANGVITFEQTNPEALYFSDRPKRLAGYGPLAMFPEIWDKGQNDFKEDPPNAALVIFGEYGSKEITIELTSVTLEGSTISFGYKLLSGEIPAEFGKNSLFIDRRQSGGDPCGTAPSSFGCQ